jgi:sugar lactone lactonase YvrE
VIWGLSALLLGSWSGLGPAQRAQAADDPTGLPVLSAVVLDTVPLPRAGLRGLAASGGGLWMLFSSNQGLSAPEGPYRTVLVAFDPESASADSLRVENDGYETGLAWDGTHLWAGGGRAGERYGIFQVDPRSGEMLEALPASGYHPGGLTWDGSYLWQIDCDARQLFRVETEEGKLSRKVRAPGFYPTGLAFDGSSFWCADASTGRLYRLRGGTGEANGVVDAAVFERPGEFISLGWDGSALWVASSRERQAVRLEILR